MHNVILELLDNANEDVLNGRVCFLIYKNVLKPNVYIIEDCCLIS